MARAEGASETCTPDFTASSQKIHHFCTQVTGLTSKTQRRISGRAWKLGPAPASSRSPLVFCGFPDAHRWVAIFTATLVLV